MRLADSLFRGKRLGDLELMSGRGLQGRISEVKPATMMTERSQSVAGVNFFGNAAQIYCMEDGMSSETRGMGIRPKLEGPIAGSPVQLRDLGDCFWLPSGLSRKTHERSFGPGGERIPARSRIFARVRPSPDENILHQKCFGCQEAA